MKQNVEESNQALSGKDEKFVDRWSRLKLQTTGGRSDAVAERPGTEDPASEKNLTDEDMPGIETLTQDSDYTGFLSPRVSDSLRRLALRKLFQGTQFNVRDGLDDYDQDFTSFTKLGGIITADMKHLLEQEQRRAAQDKSAEQPDSESRACREEAEQMVGQEAETAAEPVADERADTLKPERDESAAAPACSPPLEGGSGLSPGRANSPEPPSEEQKR